MKLRARLAIAGLLGALTVVGGLAWWRANYEWRTAEDRKSGV